MLCLCLLSLLILCILQDKQKKKLLQFVDAPISTSILFLVWLVVVRLIMPLHYKLFKRGMFFSHANAGQERFACFEFCGGPNKSPAAKILSALCDMILDPETTGRDHLLVLHLKYGSSVAGWPLALTTSLHISLVLAFCRLWRLLVHFFDQYPWLLAPAFDPDVEPEE